MATLTRQDLNFGQVVADILCEFLEVAIHLILYVREIYPSGIFQKRKKYNVPVQMSCHPELNQYIQDTLHCVKPLIQKNEAEKVVMVIMDKEHHPVERFVFEISQPPLLSISSETLLSHVEQLLRAMILKISVCDAVLDNNPPGRSSAIATKQSVPVIELTLIKHNVLIDLHLKCGFSSTLQDAHSHCWYTPGKLPQETWRKFRSSRCVKAAVRFKTYHFFFGLVCSCL
uniref:Mitotic spindle assembly checkpoint protein MAD2B n=1 Tax=Cyprinus carpio carpio TaxID=630221 RepID=A0A9J7ZQT6_CYPCA